MNEMKHIPKHWQVKKLGEVCDIQTGKYDANHAKPTGNYRFYTCAYEHFFCDTNRFSGECLILPGNGANVGEVFYYNGEFDAYQRTYVLNNIKEYPKFLFYQLHYNWKKVNKDKQFGSATNYIRMSNFTDYFIPIPPLSEQKAIVAKIEELFSELENGKKQLQTALQQLKLYRQSLLKAAFEGRLTHENIKDGKLPDGWKWVTLGEVGDIVTGSTPPKNNSEYYSNDYPFFKPTDLDAGYNVRKANDNLSRLGIEKARFLPKNSILVTCIGATIGKTGIIRNAGSCNQQINAIIPNNKFDFNYIYYQVIAPEFQKIIKKNAVATTLPILKKSKFQNLNFMFCPLSEQQQIVNELESKLTVCDSIQATITRSLQQAETLRQSILKKAFAGKLTE
jgi:type I restriction enzyme S subunit